MTLDDQQSIMFPYAVTIHLDRITIATSWLDRCGYVKWLDWKVNYVWDGNYRFEFRDEQVHTLFALRWS